MNFDAVVSGGGPAGIACATRFARLGLRVLLAERRVLPQKKCCGEFLHPTAVRELRLLDVDISSAVPIDRVWLTSGWRTFEFQINDEARSMPRPDLSGRLMDAASDSGVRFECAAIDEVQPESGGVKLRLGGHPIRTGLLIIAEGASSATARRLGLIKRRMETVYGFSLRVRSDIHRHVALGSLKGGYVGLCDLGEGFANLAGILHPAAYRRLRPRGAGWPERLLEELPAWADWISSPPEEILYQAPVCTIARRQDLTLPNVWLVGDSAGMSETAFGDGIARSLRQARLAAHYFLESHGNLRQAVELYARHVFRDAHRPSRPPLAFAGAVLRHPLLAGGLLSFFKPLIQTFCLRATEANR